LKKYRNDDFEGRKMTKYVCIGCGYESNDDNVADDTCPYCGGLFAKENQRIEAGAGELNAFLMPPHISFLFLGFFS
jgi:DNA-directed RNA polymerase subunit RPC12/RpoP